MALKVVAVTNDSQGSEPRPGSLRTNRKNNLEARMERMWLTDPQQFNPDRNACERERIRRSWDLIQSLKAWKGKQAVDLGCGWGVLSYKLKDAGVDILAVDIANNALKRLSGLHTQQHALPITKLPDDTFDLVICTDVIAYLHRDDFRLAVAEMCRMLKPDGWVICSTPVDINSEDALERFQGLFATEFRIEFERLSHFAWWIRLFQWLDAPKTFYQGWKNPEERQEGLKNRYGFHYWWYKLNSSFALGWFWGGIQFITQPLVKALKQSSGLLLFMEKLCANISDRNGISHVIVAGPRKPLFEGVEKVSQDERPFRKEIKWE